jgi:hypothetical protein
MIPIEDAVEGRIGTVKISSVGYNSEVRGQRSNVRSQRTMINVGGSLTVAWSLKALDRALDRADVLAAEKR